MQEVVAAGKAREWGTPVAQGTMLEGDERLSKLVVTTQAQQPFILVRPTKEEDIFKQRMVAALKDNGGPPLGHWWHGGQKTDEITTNKHGGVDLAEGASLANLSRGSHVLEEVICFAYSHLEMGLIVS